MCEPQFTAHEMDKNAWLNLENEISAAVLRERGLQVKLKAFYAAGDSPEMHVQLRMRIKLLKSHIIRMKIAREIGGFTIGNWGGVWYYDAEGNWVPDGGVGFAALAKYRTLFSEHNSTFSNQALLTAFRNVQVYPSWLDLNANSYDLLKIAELLGIVREIKVVQRRCRTC